MRRVRDTLFDDLASIGLELQSVSLTSLDQTDREHFNPQNAFDAEGLTRLTQEIESRRRQRNEIEQDTEVEIQLRNLKAEQEKLEIARDEEFARLEQERGGRNPARRAAQRSRRAEAEKERETEEARIGSSKAIDLARVASDQELEARRIAAEQEVRERDIQRDIAVELARHNRSIEIDTKAKEQSKVRAEAETARAGAERAAEAVETVREIERAERQKQIELIEAQRRPKRQPSVRFLRRLRNVRPLRNWPRPTGFRLPAKAIGYARSPRRSPRARSCAPPPWNCAAASRQPQNAP